MARPTDKNRLARIDPGQIAAEVDRRSDAALERAIQQATLDGSVELVAGPEPQPVRVRLHRLRPSDIAGAAADLCLFAQQGLCEGLGWPDASRAADAVRELVTRLYARPVDGATDGAPLTEALEADLGDPIALVLVAAWARWRLDQGQGVTARQLGALAGLDADVVRRMGRGGGLALDGGRPAQASAEEARRWLRARGIRGL